MNESNTWLDIETELFIGNNPIRGFVDELIWYEYDGYLIVLPYKYDETDTDDELIWVDDTKLAFKDMNEIHRFINELEKTGRKIKLFHSDEVD